MQKETYFIFNIKIILGKEKYKKNLFIFFNLLFERIRLINQQILNLKKNCKKIILINISLFVFICLYFFTEYIFLLNCKVFIMYILYNVLCFRALSFSLSLSLSYKYIFIASHFLYW